MSVAHTIAIRSRPGLAIATIACLFLTGADAMAADPAIRKVPILDNRAEQLLDPVFGRLRNHQGAAILLDGYRDGSDPIRFRAGRRPVESVFWNPPFLRDTPKHGHFIFYAHAAEETWQEYRLEVVPEDSGTLRITPCAAGGSAGNGPRQVPGLFNLVQIDRVQGSGAELVNGSFEELEDGVPVGWQRSGSEEAVPRVITDSDQAVDGKNFIETRGWKGYWQDLAVTAGEPVSLRYWARITNLERHFDLRVGLNGLDNEEPVAFTCSERSAGSAFWPVNRWRGEWAPNPMPHIGYHHGGSVQCFLARAEADWSEVSFTILPDADGSIELTLHGPRIADHDIGLFVPRAVDFGTVTVAGATLANGDLTQLGDDGLPLGWRRAGRDDIYQIVRDGFVRTWYQAGLRTILTDVAAQEPITVTLRVRTPGERDAVGGD